MKNPPFTERWGTPARNLPFQLEIHLQRELDLPGSARSHRSGIYGREDLPEVRGCREVGLRRAKLACPVWIHRERATRRIGPLTVLPNVGLLRLNVRFSALFVNRLRQTMRLRYSVALMLLSVSNMAMCIIPMHICVSWPRQTGS